VAGDVPGVICVAASGDDSGPVAGVLEAFGVDKDARGNAKASVDAVGGYATNVAAVFAGLLSSL